MGCSGVLWICTGTIMDSYRFENRIEKISSGRVNVPYTANKQLCKDGGEVCNSVGSGRVEGECGEFHGTLHVRGEMKEGKTIGAGSLKRH